MSSDLAKKIIIVGSEGLLGSALYEHLTAIHYEVIGVDVNGGPDVKGNMSDLEMLAPALEPHEDANVLINCAYPRGMLEHMKCFFNATFWAAENMRTRQGGAIINLSSIYGIIGPDDRNYTGTDLGMPLGYAMAKGGIQSLTRATATRYGRYGVRANCIALGGVFDNQDTKFVARYAKRTPLGRMANPADLLRAVMYLIADVYITGHTLVIDGGYSAW